MSLCYYCYSILCFYFCEEIVTELWLCVHPFCVIHHLCNWTLKQRLIHFLLAYLRSASVLDVTCSTSSVLGIAIRLIVILHSHYVTVVQYENIASVSKMCYQSSLNKRQCILLPLHKLMHLLHCFYWLWGLLGELRGMISYQVLWISVNWFRSWSGWMHIRINVCTCTFGMAVFFLKGSGFKRWWVSRLKKIEAKTGFA
jgi:hypothetical protein